MNTAQNTILGDSPSVSIAVDEHGIASVLIPGPNGFKQQQLGPTLKILKQAKHHALMRPSPLSIKALSEAMVMADRQSMALRMLNRKIRREMWRARWARLQAVAKLWGPK